MKKLEEIINLATDGRKNVIITVGILLVVGYLVGFVGIKLM